MEKKLEHYFNIGDINDDMIYIEDDTSEKDGTDCNKLNISWVESVEKELSSSIDTKIFSYKTGHHKNIDANQVISENYNKLSDSNILEYQIIILNNLKKILKNDINEINIEDFLMKLDWILETSKYLSDKVKILITEHKILNKNIISRSSYKFCNFNFECEYNYNVKKHSGCYAQHYVHNLVYADIDSLKKYIIFCENDKNIEEIKKTINTISFVVNHMYDELQNAQKFNFFNTDDAHIERTPKKKRVTKNKIN